MTRSLRIVPNLVAGLFISAMALAAGAAQAAELGRGEVYAVVELAFAGPHAAPKDAPARDVEFAVRLRHASGKPEYTIQGFWDGDGRGGSTGNVFKVRFCPTSPGRWYLVDVKSNAPTLKGQHEGDHITAVESTRPGFWFPDPASGGRWYRRSDGSHPYVFGNTHYSFLSETTDKGSNSSNIARDVRDNAKYFKKLRFGLSGCRYPHPTERAFRDNEGRPTDDGDFSHRPDPGWFHTRVDAAVRTAFEVDVIADLILAGPDAVGARSTLRAAANGGDAVPYLRYVAARYGSYPNVWLCLCNEWDIKNPTYTADEISKAGAVIRRFLPYPTPLSVHGKPADWNTALNSSPAWHDHVILQNKIRTLDKSADYTAKNFARGGHTPVVNDELGYQGKGDGFSREDVVEGHLGALLGGGYGTTGFKPAAKKGQYFWGAFDADEHTAAQNLGWLARAIDAEISFWQMQPVDMHESIFANAGTASRSMAWAGHEYLLGTNGKQKAVEARLPAGRWRVRCLDVLGMQATTLAEAAEGRFTFDAPASRAVLFHFKREP